MASPGVRFLINQSIIYITNILGIARLNDSTAELVFYSRIHKLKLNPDKTEFLLIGNERQRSKYHYVSY